MLRLVCTFYCVVNRASAKGGSQATSGWALGLAIGGMLAIVLITRKIQADFQTATDLATILLIGFFAPRVEAIITAFHGTLMLRGKRWEQSFEQPSGVHHL